VRALLLLLLVAACGGRASDPGPGTSQGTGGPETEYPAADPTFGDGGGRPLKSCDCPAAGYGIEAELAGETIRFGGISAEISTEPFCKNVAPSCIFAQTWKTHYTLTLGACATDRKACALLRYNTNTREPVKDEGRLTLGDRTVALSKLTADRDPLDLPASGPLVVTFTGLADGAPITLRANVCVAAGTVLPF
jgi:hypothetical protein